LNTNAYYEKEFGTEEAKKESKTAVKAEDRFLEPPEFKFKPEKE